MLSSHLLRRGEVGSSRLLGRWRRGNSLGTRAVRTFCRNPGVFISLRTKSEAELAPADVSIELLRGDSVSLRMGSFWSGAVDMREVPFVLGPAIALLAKAKEVAFGRATPVSH